MSTSVSRAFATLACAMIIAFMYQQHEVSADFLGLDNVKNTVTGKGLRDACISQKESLALAGASAGASFIPGEGAVKAATTVGGAATGAEAERCVQNKDHKDPAVCPDGNPPLGNQKCDNDDPSKCPAAPGGKKAICEVMQLQGDKSPTAYCCAPAPGQCPGQCPGNVDPKQKCDPGAAAGTAASSCRDDYSACQYIPGEKAGDKPQAVCCPMSESQMSKTYPSGKNC